uniref:Uncharacterized protein n=1 Tax=Glossina pallidipes TaxID=7398 RepID=A0A1A9Z2S5_GLOPL
MFPRAQELEFVSRKQLYKRCSNVCIPLIKDFMSKSAGLWTISCSRNQSHFTRKELINCQKLSSKYDIAIQLELYWAQSDSIVHQIWSSVESNWDTVRTQLELLCYKHFMQAMYCRICQLLLNSVKSMETCNLYKAEHSMPSRAEAIGQKNEDANYEGSLLSARAGGGRQTAKHRITGYSRTQIHNDNIKRP